MVKWVQGTLTALENDFFVEQNALLGGQFMVAAIL